jgi:glycosyltransferase involved in cell wall biosynthesis
VKPLHVLFVTATRSWSGGERCMATVAGRLGERGHRVLLTYDPRGSVGEWLPAELPKEPVAIRGDGDLPAIHRLRRLARGLAAEVVCVNTFRELKVGGIAARLAGARIVNRMGGIDALYTGRRERLLYRALVDVMVRDSDWGCRRIAAENPWFARPVLRARNGVDAAALRRVQPIGRAALGAAAGEVLVAVVGAATAAKGTDVLADALRRVAADGGGLPPLRVLFIGPSGPEQDLLQRIASTGSGVRASVLGPRPPAETLQILAAADLLAHPSRYEGLPFTVLEAMGLGLPVVASAVGGIPEAVLDGVTGRLVQPGDAGALAAALRESAATPALRRRWGAAAQARIAAEFDESSMIDAYETAFATARAGTGRRG